MSSNYEHPVCYRCLMCPFFSLYKLSGCKINYYFQKNPCYSQKSSWNSSCSGHEIACECAIFHCGLLCPTEQSNNFYKIEKKIIMITDNCNHNFLNTLAFHDRKIQNCKM